MREWMIKLKLQVLCAQNYFAFTSFALPVINIYICKVHSRCFKFEKWWTWEAIRIVSAYYAYYAVHSQFLGWCWKSWSQNDLANKNPSHVSVLMIGLHLLSVTIAMMKNDRRNSGGTLRQNLNDIWHMTFDIWHLTLNIGHSSNGPMDEWTNGPIDQWTNGPID